MSSLHFTFGEQIQTGELARAPQPTDEMEVEMAMALGQPPARWPPIAVVPVLLNGQQLGVIEKIRFVHGGTVYSFHSDSGNTMFCCSTVDGVLQRLKEVLGFTSPQSTDS